MKVRLPWKAALQIEREMNKGLFIFLGAVIIFNLTGCSSLKQIRKLYSPKVSKPAQPEAIPLYTGPKVYIAVADFEVKVAKANNDVGSGLRDMLITALSKNGRFLILNGQQLLKPEEGKIDSQPQENKPETADLIISAIVTEFEPLPSGGSDGIGGGGGLGNGNFGGLLGEVLNKAHLAININVVNPLTSEVLAAGLVKGQSLDPNELIKGELLADSSLDRRLLSYADTPMEKAIRKCLIEAVRYITQAIAANSYKYSLKP